MEDQFGKYLRLFGTIFFTVLGFLLALVLLMLGIKLLFGLMAYIPWSVYIYMLFIILVPASVFIPVYLVYFTRTKTHPHKTVRIISFIFFSLAIMAWMVSLVSDLVTFFKHAYPSIGMYRSYDMLFLAANVAGIFLTGVMQALTTGKEKDWMERARN